MIARLRVFSCPWPPAVLCAAAALQFAIFQHSASTINVLVDYSYDTNNFFDTQEKKNTIEAAAARLSAIITTSLSAAALNDPNVDPRIGFTHPGTGDSFQVSSAPNLASDIVAIQPGAAAADEYRGAWSIPANQWIVYAGGRSLDPGIASEGGTKTGSNLSSLYLDDDAHVNRDFRATGSNLNLPVWGGSVSFDNDGSTVWHFNHTTAVPNNWSDLYSYALHEIGHALGLNIGPWHEWILKSPSDQFFGPQAIAAYNGDNVAPVTFLNEEAVNNNHWKRNTYHSFIFQSGSPNFVDTVGSGALQDLLMEPGLARSVRIELTNVDVAALRDVGWSTIPQPITQPGDFNGNGAVDAGDYIPVSKGLASGTYATWRANYGESLPPSSPAADFAHVPEPKSTLLAALAALSAAAVVSRRRQHPTGGMVDVAYH